MKALGRSSVSLESAAAAMGLGDQPDRATRLVAALVAEGLVVEEADALRLP
jgi:hypothetical protein